MLRPTKASELTDVILTRNAFVEGPDGGVRRLTLTFHRPRLLGGGEVEASLRFACEYFDKTMAMFGEDDVQALAFLLFIGQIEIGLLADKGYEIWWSEKGDREFFDFWSYQEKPSEFCLPSAYHSTALEAFKQATEGQFLMPSTRVAIEPDRPGITTYAVQPDGRDVVDGFIGPDALKNLDPDELCRRLGHMILVRTPEGRKLLGLEPR